MKKYTLTEKQLYVVLERVISEELQSAINEGVLGNVLKNTALMGAKAVTMPFTSAGRLTTGVNDIIFGKKNPVDSIKSFVGPVGNNQKNNAKRDTASQNYKTIKGNFGEPETEVGLGRKLERKKPIVVQNFLGSGRDVNFGKHYYEKNQDAVDSNGNPLSVWGKKLKDAETEINNARRQNRVGRYVQQYYQDFKKWLNERDIAYENWIKNNRK